VEAVEAGGSICLDTSILIDNLRGKKGTVDFLRKLEDAGTGLSTTAVNSFELFYGAYKSEKRVNNLAAAKTLLSRLMLLDLTVEASDEAARILSLLEEKGYVIGFRDVLIAAIALTNDMTLVTNDVDHFRRVPGLEVLTAQ